VFGEKTVHGHDDIYQNLEAGIYFIRMRMLWKSPKYKTAVLVSYASQNI
jgi:hypothetical protein